MLFSRAEILKALSEKRIAITPFDGSCVGAASVDLHLGNAFRMFRSSRKALDVTEETDADGLTKLVRVKAGGWFSIPSGGLVLGVTRERIRLAPGIAGFLMGRSRFARVGLAVHVSSSFVQPGVDNVQVLEMLNSSPYPLRVKPGLKVCQILFEEVRGQSVYEGRYRFQDEP